MGSEMISAKKCDFPFHFWRRSSVRGTYLETPCFQLLNATHPTQDWLCCRSNPFDPWDWFGIAEPLFSNVRRPIFDWVTSKRTTLRWAAEPMPGSLLDGSSSCRRRWFVEPFRKVAHSSLALGDAQRIRQKGRPFGGSFSLGTGGIRRDVSW